ncbi:MAG: DnaD domain protein [Clostridia bacterium]|nr:DnaD domain protein [Clostridia bacterium]
MLSPVVVDELQDILQTHTSELLELAITEAAKANARNIKYIRGILRN